MIKYTVTSNSAPGVDEAKWRTWHIGQHTDFIAKFPGLRRLVTWKVIDPEKANLPPLNDVKGFAYNHPVFTYSVEFYYDTLEAQRKAYISDQAIAGRADSIGKPGYVVNSRRYCAELVDDRTFRGPPSAAAAIKYVVTWNTAPDLEERQWRRWYVGEHTDLVAKFPGLRRLVTWKTVDEADAKLPELQDVKGFSYNHPGYKLMVELHYDSLDEQRRAYVSEAAEAGRADSAAQPAGYVIGAKRYCAVLVDERVFTPR